MGRSCEALQVCRKTRRTSSAVPQKAIREHIDEDDVLKWNITDSRIHRKAAKPENALSTHVDSDDKTTTLNQGSGYENPSRDVNRHVEIEDRYVLSSQNYQNGSFEITTRGRTIINESGLYSVILRSKTEKAFLHTFTSFVH